ncbi:MAG: class I SAM-dependent methyltransferase [Patescibacteria group bacterium]
MTRQEFYRKKYKKINPEWQDSLTLYKEIIDKYVNQETRILDIGCGHGDYLKDVYSKTSYTYGIDPDRSALSKNSIIKNKFCFEAETLSFCDNFFDLVVNAWVMEHLINPYPVFKEIFRVLKPSGKLIFLTPNSLNYNIWIIRAVPQKFHHFFTHKLYDRQEHDTFSKYYKVNSMKKIDKMLLPLGFNKIQFICNGDPTYISFNNLFFKIAVWIENIINNKFPDAKVHLIGIYEKSSKIISKLS